jgi:CRISPR system Cascade subunit CasD
MTESLVLRFAGPQQSWGTTELADRNTEPVPTRNAIVGMLAATLGASRGSWPEWLSGIDVWVRVDRVGTLSTDFHTVGAPPLEVGAVRKRHRTATGRTGPANFAVPMGNGNGWILGGGTMVTNRQYLADAEFIVAIHHSDSGHFAEMVSASHNPVFMTYLGRKAFAPTFPFHLGVHRGSPRDVLTTMPTRANFGRALTIHEILGDRNFAVERVTPPVTDAWSGWAA